MSSSPWERRRLRLERLEGRHMLASLPSVVGAHLIYNNSAFDGDDPAANAADDAAIATDKTPLSPGGDAVVCQLLDATTRASTRWRSTSRTSAPRSRRTASRSRSARPSAPQSWAPRRRRRGSRCEPAQGAGGSDRATWNWADGAIKNTWLQVTLNATGAVFYFGNTPGETGNSPANAFVSAADEIGVRQHGGAAGRHERLRLQPRRAWSTPPTRRSPAAIAGCCPAPCR